MAVEIRVSRADDLSFVNAVIHDQFFELDAVRFEEKAERLVIPFEFEDVERQEVLERNWRGRAKRAQIPLRRAELSIQRAIQVELADAERVGVYDFDQLEYDEVERRLAITTNIPLEFAALVRAIDVSVSVFQEKVGSRPVRYIGGLADVRDATVPRR